jgi:uncharacterized repeat protein (TIGR01451 family)/gliding motility-associated-like protein
MEKSPNQSPMLKHFRKSTSINYYFKNIYLKMLPIEFYKKKLIFFGILSFVIFSSFNATSVKAQCTSVTSFTLSSQNATCTANGSITITVPTLSSGNYCVWTAQITRTGSNAVVQNIPAAGGDLVFSSLLPGEYTILLTDGNTELTHPNVTITTSYVTMAVSSSSVAPSCSSSLDGTLTVNVANGVGPFVYTVTSQFGTQTHITANRSHTFGNMGAGETVGITVTDQVNGQSGCSTSVNSSRTIDSPTLAPIAFNANGRPFNFEKDCSNIPGSCETAKLFVNVLNVTPARLTNLQNGGATITIGGSVYPLSFVGFLGSVARFTYDPIATGGPALVNNTSFTTTFNDGCSILTRTANVPMKNDYLVVQPSTIIDPLTCEKKYRLQVIGDQDISQSGYVDRAVYFCEQNTVTILKRDDNLVFQPVSVDPDPSTLTNDLNVTLGILIPTAVRSFFVTSPGVYKVIATDGCTPVERIITVVDSNPLNVVNLRETNSVIEGTSTIQINFPGVPPIASPLKIRLTRVDGQTNMTLNAAQPLSMAGSYSYTFPMEFTFPDYPSPELFIGDLPLGEYNVTITDACDVNTITRTINLTNPTQYNPNFSVTEGCVNSNSISFNMNPVNALNLRNNVQIFRKNANGSTGALLGSFNGALSGTFNNLSSGDYIIRFSNIRYFDFTIPQRNYSAAFSQYRYHEYTKEITIAPYEDFSVDTSIAFCSIADPNSGIVSAQITSGTIVYPVSFTLFQTANPSTPFQPTVNITSGSANAVFQNVPVGDYFIRVATACSSKDVSVSVATTSTIPQARVSDAAVCPGSPTTLAVISATNNLYDIEWEIKNADGTFSPALGSDGVQLRGMPVPLSPTVTTTYRAVFRLMSTFGCTNNVTYYSEVEVKVTPDPDLVTPKVTDIDLCKNPNPSVTISNSEAGFIYEILNPQGLSFSPKITGLGNGGDLVLAIPFNQLTAGTTLSVSSTNGNAGCNGILEDAITVSASTANLAVEVEGSYVCLGSDGTITVKGSELGITYTVLKGGVVLSPSITSVGTGNDLTFTIPSALLTEASNEFTIQASGAGCATGILEDVAVLTVQQAPSSSSSVDAICGVNNGKGTIVVSTFGGSGDYEYSLDNVTWQDANTFTVDPGTYTVYSKDKGNGCVSSSSVTIGLYCLEIIKTNKTLANQFSAVGDVFSYDITVKNTGNVTLNNITVEDPLTGLSETISSLAVNGSQTFSTSYTVKYSDLGLSEVKNIASAAYTTPSQEVFVEDSVTIPNAHEIDGIECGGNSYAIANGKAIDILVRVSYTGGVAGSYAAGHAIDLGNGTLTATLQAGNIDPLGGELVYRLVGTPSDASPVILPVYFGGQECEVTIYIYEPTLASITFYVYPFNDKNNNCERERDLGEGPEGLPESGIFIKVFDLEDNLLYASEIELGQFSVVDLNINSDEIYYYIIDTNDDGTDLTPGLPMGWSSGMPAPNLKRYFQFDGSIILINTTANPNLLDPSWENIFPLRVCMHQEEGEIEELDCENADFSEEIFIDQSTSNLTFTVDYIGGNGGFIDFQQILSTGIEGLTATLEEGSLAVGSGRLTFKLSGVASQGGIGSFLLNVGGESCEVEFFVSAPGLTIEKEVLEMSYEKEGDELNYTITVTNTGNVTLSDITVEDPLTGFSETISSLAVDGSVTFSTSYSIVAADLLVGQVKNVAKASFAYGALNYEEEATATSTLDQSGRGISVSVEAVDFTFDHAGDEVRVQYSVRNSGNLTLFNVLVEDASTGFSQLLEKLEPGQEVVFTELLYVISQEDFRLGYKEYEVRAKGFTSAGLEAEAVDYDEVLKRIIERIDVKVTANVDKISAVGQVVIYRYEVRNIGNSDIGRVSVKDPTTGLDVVLAELLYDEVKVIEVEYVVKQEDIDRGFISNVVTAEIERYFNSGQEGTKAQDDELVEVDQSPKLLIEKEVLEMSYEKEGDELNYTLTVTNTGNVTLSDITVEDPLTGFSETISSLTVDGSVTLSTSYSIVAADVLVGQVKNVAKASFAYGALSYQEEATATSTLDQSGRGISVSVEAVDFTFDHAGDEVRVQYSVRNSGNLTLFNVLVEDASTGFSQTLEKLEPGQEVVFAESLYVISQEDFRLGYKEYEVRAKGYTSAGLEAEAVDYDEVLKRIIERIDVKVTANVDKISAVGQVVIYRYEVRNIGNSDLGRVSVKDPTTGLDVVLAELLYDEVKVIEVEYVVKQEDIDRGFISNVVTAEIERYFNSGQEGTKAQDDELVEVDQSPKLLIVKKVDKEFFSELGEELKYTIKVTNTGNVTLKDVKVTDKLTGDLWMIEVLLPKGEIEFSTKMIVDQDFLNSGEINNVAKAEYNFGSSAYEGQSSALTKFKNQRNSIEANIDNFQDNAVDGYLGGIAGNVLLNDLLNGVAVKFVDVDITVKDNGGILGLMIDAEGNLIVPAGTAKGTYTIIYGICEKVDVSNCDEAIVIVEVFEGVDLSITKTVNNSTWYEGDEVEYVIKVVNVGNVVATGVEIKDVLSEGLRYVSSVVSDNKAITRVNGQEIVWTLETLAVGAEVEIVLKVKLAPLSSGFEQTIINTAVVESKEKDSKPLDNTSTVSIKVKPFFIPNTITPNGNGFNDSFEIPGLGRFVSNEIVIFNRWGDHVFEAKDYQNNWSGEGLVSHTYFYVLKAVDEQGKEHVYKGFIQVEKNGRK